MRPGFSSTARLIAATLLAVGAGVAFLVKVLQGAESIELLEFTTIYIAAPLACSLLLLFSWMKQKQE